MRKIIHLEDKTKNFTTVQALASKGNEIALGYALCSTHPADLLIVSPLFRGSNPYPFGSLTYRSFLPDTIITKYGFDCQSFLPLYQ